MTLYPFQEKVLQNTDDKNHVAYYLDMGLGKTFVGSEKLFRLSAAVNLVVCQKSKIDDWVNHFIDCGCTEVYNLTDPKDYEAFFLNDGKYNIIGIINYDLIFRRPEIKTIKGFTLLLDESSLIQNPGAERTKFITKLSPANVILLSGTPTGGKYERLLTQMNLLGWKISEDVFWSHYVDWSWEETPDGFWAKKIKGYKNEERLKRKMRQHGCCFLKTDEVFDLPAQIDQRINVPVSEYYRQFKKHSYVVAYGMEFIGDTTLTKMLYERELCGWCNRDKVAAFRDLLMSTEDRLLVFYNFTVELQELLDVCKDRQVSIINGNKKDLTAYENNDDSVTFIQYQAGAMGLNLQKANKIIYFTPPLSSELFEQSKKRVHRMGQDRPCFYYYLVCRGSVEERIYNTLAMRRDYTEELFKEDEINK